MRGRRISHRLVALPGSAVASAVGLLYVGKMPGTLLRSRLLVGTFALTSIAFTQTACTSILGDFTNGGGGDASTGDATTPGSDAMTSGGDSGPGLGTACTE